MTYDGYRVLVLGDSLIITYITAACFAACSVPAQHLLRPQLRISSCRAIRFKAGCGHPETAVGTYGF